ncbi:MAG: hypothetical protein EBZ69_07870 [Alphaproteobacteria bacterium]|nr:hypothetical protein [Alphaproteobacteria bacterium]
MLIQVALWNDELADSSWLQCASDDAVWYLTPSLGPSGTIVLHHVSQWLNASFGLPATFGREAMASMFGLTGSTLQHVLKRLEMFGFARQVTDFPDRQCWQFRTSLPPLSRRFARRMPLTLLQTCPYLGFIPTEGETHDQA